jgi:integrase
MRQPKPFLRKQTKTWYVQIDKRQINLGPDEEIAWAKYHELMTAADDLNYYQATVVQLLDTYLEWCQKRRSAGTYENNLLYCKSFTDCIGKRLKIRQLKPKHITSWMDLHPDWAPSTKNDAISIVQRAFNWAVRQGHIDRTPIPYIEDKPTRTRREIVYSPEQFQKILSVVTDDLFRDLLEFLWETGCRPHEARKLETRHIDVKNQMAVLEVSLNKTRKGQRVIYLTDRALEIIKTRIGKNGDNSGPVFQNRGGRPWTKDAIKCRFQRIKRLLGNDRMCAYGIRHSFATEGLKNSVDPVSLSILMGHSDATMIAKTYQHLAKDPAFLRTQAKKARGE